MTKAIVKQSGIYAIINTVTGVRYVGQSCDIRDRKCQHFKELKKGNHHCIYLQRAYNKHGKDAFIHEIIELCDDKKLITEREQFWMDKYSATGIYNHAKAAGSPKGLKRSEESKLKMSLAKKGKILSEDTKRKMREAQAKIKELKSAAAKAQWQRPGEIEKISEKRKGRVTSDETKKLISKRSLEMWSDPEYKKRLSDKQKIAQSLLKESKSKSLKKNWSNPEFRQKMQLAQRNR